MSQTTPPGNGPDDRRDGTQPENNPYFNRVDPEPTPDLDAAAPRLRTVEERRLDRKALLFLGGILLLLLAMGYLLFRKGNEPEPAPVPRAEARTTTPVLPTIPSATPIEAPAEPIPMLPPPPVDDTAPSYAGGDRGDRGPRGPTLLERRIAAAEALGEGQGQTLGQYPQPQGQANPYLPGGPLDPAAQGAGGGGAQGAQGGMMGREGEALPTSAAFIRSPDALLVRGTYLRCVLETRIITDIPGYTSCLVTEPVYSINGRTLLLPKGSKIYGSYNGGPVAKRVDVIWDRITTPNGIDVAMSSPGTDGLGGAGVPGQYTAHWGKRLTSALMISLLADAFKYAAAENGPETTTIGSNGFAVQSPYESATARTMERLAGEALSDRPQPTVTVNQGTVMNVYVAKDVDFSAVLGRRM